MCLVTGKGRGMKMSASFSPNATNESGEEINGTPAPEEETLDKNTQDVLVIPFGPTIGESVGLLSEQKVRIRTSTEDHTLLFYIFLIVYLTKPYVCVTHTFYKTISNTIWFILLLSGFMYGAPKWHEERTCYSESP